MTTSFNDMYGKPIEEGDRVLVAFKYGDNAMMREGTIIEIVPDYSKSFVSIKEVYCAWKDGRKTRIASLHATRFYILEKHTI